MFARFHHLSGPCVWWIYFCKETKRYSNFLVISYPLTNYEISVMIFFFIFHTIPALFWARSQGGLDPIPGSKGHTAGVQHRWDASPSPGTDTRYGISEMPVSLPACHWPAGGSPHDAGRACKLCSNRVGVRSERPNLDVGGNSESPCHTRPPYPRSA